MKGYQINVDLTLEESLKEVILECISYIQDQIKNHQEVHTTVHETRRTIKRIRAILRMIRDEIGNYNYHRENTFYRLLSGGLSSLRDSYVLLKTITDFNKKFPEEFPDRYTKEISDSLKLRLDKDFEQFFNQWGGFDSMIGDLDEARSRVEDFCMLRDEFVSIRKGIRRIYKRGFRHLRIIHEAYNEEQFHEYRKNTKYLLYHMELIIPAYPKVIKAYSRIIDKHAELLGDTRDYVQLEEYIFEGVASRSLDVNSRDLIFSISAKRQELMQEIYSGANTIYTEKPTEFINRLTTYWNKEEVPAKE